jgi:serine/threonine-protein kinase
MAFLILSGTLILFMKGYKMKQLQFVQLHKDNENHRAVFEPLFWEYHAEQCEHNPKLRESPNPRYTAEEFWQKWFNSIIDIQGDSDRHLELCYEGNNLVGFLYGKVDHEKHNGFIKPGWGYVMEFYVRPEYRRKGYGRAMAERLEALFAADGATQIYLNTPTIMGTPFWTAMGYAKTDEISTENGKPIWVKTIALKMKQLQFIQVRKDNESREDFKSLYWDYNDELCEHDPSLLVSPNPHYTAEEFRLKCFEGTLEMLGDSDRHLELCYDGETIIGFLEGVVEHEHLVGFIKPGWGCVREFYVKPECRRKGYGRAMAERLEALFAVDGAKMMYLTPDNVTGVPFWTAMGFTETDEINTDNGMKVWVKAVERSKLISFRVVDYPSPELFKRIVASRWNGDPNAAFMLSDTLCGGKWFSDSFSVVAETNDNQIVGYVSFSQNEQDSAKWYMANLGVVSAYRKRRIATQMIKTGLARLTDIGAKQLYSATEPSNTASIALHRSFGFAEIAAVPFNGFDLSGQIMFRIDVPSNLNATLMTLAHIPFVFGLLMSPHNKSTLNPANLTYDEWKATFERNRSDPDEANFIIRRGIVSVAWLKLNGLSGSGRAWISMLVVHENYQRQGVGSFAIHYAEDYVKEKGFTALGIHANAENTAAVNCYKNAGYIITEEGDCTNGDGSHHRGYTLVKDHLDAVRMCIDGVYFRMGEAHDFSFLSEIGRVFRAFDAMDSGNICFGVECDGKRYFVKYAGARTMDYKGEISDAVARLKAAVRVYENLQHPALIRLVRHFPVGDGYAAVFDWVDGEGFFSYWDYSPWEMKNNPQSPNARFRHLPIEKRIAVVDKIFDFHHYIASCGYVPVDFYDGSLLYDFARDELHICDIDFYRKAPVVNDMGKWWGSSRFLSPEEKTLSAAIDEVTTVYTMGAAAFVLLGSGGYDVDRTFASWNASKALFDVATKAVSDERSERYQSLDELIAAWEQAKGVYDIEYKRLDLSDLSPDMLKSFHRYKEVKKSWRKIDGEWVLIDNPYIEDWDDDFKNKIITEDFPQAIKSGGAVFGAYDDGKLIGFFALDGNLIGSEKQYAWLVLCHVSAEYRHHGIGKKLFNLAVEVARGLGTPKMYISANSSEESQAFYRAVGCVHAEEIIPELFEAEPYDVHMEYLL